MAVGRHHTAGHKQTLERLFRSLPGVITGLRMKTFRRREVGDCQIALSLPNPGVNTRCHRGFKATASDPIAAQ